MHGYSMSRSVPTGGAHGEGGEAASAEREAALEALLAALEARDAAAERVQAARTVMAAPVSCCATSALTCTAAVSGEAKQPPELQEQPYESGPVV
jgi:hypothetical protein